MNELTLRPCRYEDLGRVLALEEASFADSAYRMIDFEYFMERAGDGFTVAEEGGRLLGYVIAIDRGGEEGMIASVAVSPESRGKGIGEALMKAAVGRLGKDERIFLLVDPSNAAAISLYHKFSFRETGRVFREYYRNGADAIEMVRAEGGGIRDGA
jgi:ribosomal-protein-alanine N-acetyltransferase